MVGEIVWREVATKGYAADLGEKGRLEGKRSSEKKNRKRGDVYDLP